MSSFFRSSTSGASDGRRSSLSASLRGRPRKSSCAEPARPPLEPQLWPYVWALRNRRLLDWSAGLDDAAERAEVKRLARLPVDVRDDLFLGDAACARDGGRLRALGVTHVLNAAGAAAAAPAALYAAAGIETLVLEARDDDRYPMLETHLAAARAFLAAGRGPGKRVLVHCVQGLNRSAGLVAAGARRGTAVACIVQQCIDVFPPWLQLFTYLFHFLNMLHGHLFLRCLDQPRQP